MKRLPDDIAAKLLEASSQLTGKGLNVSVDEVAQMADIPRATLYYYFSGKDDLIGFFMHDKLTRLADAIGKASAEQGPAPERLAGVMRAILHALAEHPALCVELPVALKESGDYEQVVASAERIVIAPLRELLIEGKATGEFTVPDVDTATIALMGALNMVGMMSIVRTGSLDAERVAEVLVPQLLQGICS
jgi:AcrR family transcriptional regulator